MHATELSVRAEHTHLPAGAESVRSLIAEAGRARHRLVELQGTAPFDAALRWSAGSGLGNAVRFSLARAGRICFFARTVQLHLSDRSGLDQDVSVAVSDGSSRTHNVLDQIGTGDGSWQRFAVAPFALAVRADTHDRSKRSTARLRLVDAAGLPFATLRINELPDAGLPVGLAHSVELRVPLQGPMRFRLAFDLAL